MYGFNSFLVSPDADIAESPESPSSGQAQDLVNTPAQDHTVTPADTPPTTSKMVSPDSTSPGPDETISER